MVESQSLRDYIKAYSIGYRSILYNIQEIELPDDLLKNRTTLVAVIEGRWNATKQLESEQSLKQATKSSLISRRQE